MHTIFFLTICKSQRRHLDVSNSVVIRINIGIAKVFFLLSEIVFEHIKHLNPINSIFFLNILRYSTSLSLCYIYSFFYFFYCPTIYFVLFMPFRIHPTRGIYWCSRRKTVWILRSTLSLAFEKIAAPKTFWIFLVEPAWRFLFKYTCRPLREFSKQLFSSSYSVENLLAPASLNRNSTAFVILVILQYFKNT